MHNGMLRTRQTFAVCIEISIPDGNQVLAGSAAHKAENVDARVLPNVATNRIQTMIENVGSRSYIRLSSALHDIMSMGQYYPINNVSALIARK